jgi:hypothetical protein
VPPERPQKPRFREHPIEFLLALFGEVRPGEGTTVVLLTFNVFLILSAYYLLKVAREPLILLGGGAEVKSYTSVGQSILLVFVASFYGWLAARVGRAVLISCVSLFFIANLLIFFGLGRLGGRSKASGSLRSSASAARWEQSRARGSRRPSSAWGRRSR